MLAANVCASDVPAQARASHALPRARGAHAREARGAARISQGLRAGADRRRQAARERLREAAWKSTKLRPDALLLQTVMLRSLQQAVYSPDNVGHFGLAYESYTHFTSPIRRYPGSARAPRHQGGARTAPLRAGRLARAGTALLHDRAARRRGDARRRRVAQVLLHAGPRRARCSRAASSGVTSFGVFVALDDIYVEGLVHVSELGSDYFHFDAAKHQLMGERTHRRFRLGDRVRVSSCAWTWTRPGSTSCWA